MFRLSTWGLAAAIAAAAAWGQEWRAAYAYDRPGEQLVFTDLAFPSPERGIAVGVLRDSQGRDREAVALLTSDGGRIWNQVALEEAPVSLHFLDATRGWMVTTGGIWRTEDSGLSWMRLSRHAQNAVAGVWFLDSLHGFAVGREKMVIETRDGGTRWTAVPEAAEPTGDPSYTGYTHIAFADDQHGLIVGAGVPPNAAKARRQAPTMTVQLQTLNGGLVWAASAAPLFGQVSGLRLTRSDGLIVFSYADTFEWPAEVYRLDLRTGRTTSVFKQKDRAVTGTALFEGAAFLAVTEPKARANPARGKVRVLTTTDFLKWTEMKVDKRASGSRVLLAGPDAEHLWAATDTGVLLRRVSGKN
jgi:photosystem II stability/assembly factor-like uncharacterized protein